MFNTFKTLEHGKRQGMMFGIGVMMMVFLMFAYLLCFTMSLEVIRKKLKKRWKLMKVSH